jgi:hypothetical protein
MKNCSIVRLLLLALLCVWLPSSAFAVTPEANALSGTSWNAVIGREGDWNKYTDLVFGRDGKFYEVNYVYYDSDMNAGYTLLSVVEGTYFVSENILRRTGTIAVYDRANLNRKTLVPYNEEHFFETRTTLRISSDRAAKGLIYNAAPPREDWSGYLGFNREPPLSASGTIASAQDTPNKICAIADFERFVSEYMNLMAEQQYTCVSYPVKVLSASVSPLKTEKQLRAFLNQSLRGDKLARSPEEAPRPSKPFLSPGGYHNKIQPMRIGYVYEHRPEGMGLILTEGGTFPLETIRFARNGEYWRVVAVSGILDGEFQ